MKQQRKIYDLVFVSKAVALIQKRSYISELARKSGIRNTLLYNCRKE
jgi:DNA-binding phage protein